MSFQTLRIAFLKRSPLGLSSGLAYCAVLALRIHGYLTPYVTDHPTIDRYDETIERIAEDFYSKPMPRTGPRHAMVQIGSPIDVRVFSEMKLREALASLSDKMERTVQDGRIPQRIQRRSGRGPSGLSAQAFLFSVC